MRAPTSGKPLSVRSITRGASGTRPLNHGLTVCRSDELTSTGWGAISARMWLATTGFASVPAGAVRDASQVAPLLRQAARTVAAANARHDMRAGLRLTLPTRLAKRARLSGAGSRGA